MFMTNVIREPAGVVDADRLTGVQCLRGLAALMVVVVHYHGTAAARQLEFPLLSRLDFAAAGVDIFFVISGFIMELSASRDGRHLTAGGFLLRRAIRILPLYWTLTVLAYSAALVLGKGVHAQTSLQQFLLSMLLLPDRASDGSAAYIISVAWSLSYEAYFYLVFALLLQMAPSRRLAILSVLFVATSFVGALVRPDALVLKLATDPMTLEFLMGAMLARLYRQGVRVGPAISAGLFLAGVLGLAFAFDTADLHEWRLLRWGLPAAVLVASTVLGEARLPALVMRSMSYLGDISYSLYLSHFLSIALFVRIHAWWFGGAGGSALGFAAGLIGLSLLVAQLCYVFIERPSRRVLTRHLTGNLSRS